MDSTFSNKALIGTPGRQLVDAWGLPSESVTLVVDDSGENVTQDELDLVKNVITMHWSSYTAGFRAFSLEIASGAKILDDLNNYISIFKSPFQLLVGHTIGELDRTFSSFPTVSRCLIDARHLTDVSLTDDELDSDEDMPALIQVDYDLDDID